MCGIAGIVGRRGIGNVAAMVSAMHHRGPDDRGVVVGDGYALGMARLSIIDTSPAGHQPMCSRDGLITLVYNGETFNFAAERKELEARGHEFSSHSDTEVVLRMYEEYGEAFLGRIRGMFALALYDRRSGPGRERLLLARDHLGIKPLLYAETAGCLVFASEMKSILASGLLAREVSSEGLRLLLTFGSITQPETAVRGVRMLPPGSRLLLERGVAKVERYWDLGVGRRATDLVGLGYPELVSLVRAELEECVRLQMVSDVPLGAFLSGGVDSSLLVALMARISRQPIRTFSVGFDAEGAAIDETADAMRVASFVGTEHRRIAVTGADVRDHILRIARALDQPSVDGVNSYFVSLAARQAVTVAISGTGGDELFAGYPWFITMVKEAGKGRQDSIRRRVGRLVAEAARNPAFDSHACNGWSGRVLQRIRASHGFLPRFARIYQIFGACGAANLLAEGVRRQANVGREQSLDILSTDELGRAEPLERVSALCLRGYTTNQLLRDIDAVSMAHSLEVRVPFLDTRLADLALSLPWEAKLGKLETVANPETASYRETGTKRILIDIGRELLPPGMDIQPKRGFAMPFASWLNGAVREVFDDALSPAATLKRGIFAPSAIAGLHADFVAGRVGWAQPWLVMMTELWCREVLDQTSASDARGN